MFSYIVLYSFAIILLREREKEMVALLWLSSWCLVTVSVLWPIIHGAVGWYAVWDCGISWLNSLTFFLILLVVK